MVFERLERVNSIINEPDIQVFSPWMYLDGGLN